MAVRPQQMHPAFVHLPIALLPLAVGADLLGCATGNGSLHNFGRKAIAIAAAGALGSAVAGLIAGEEVNVEGVSHDMLVTHRNLNFVATVVATSMAVWRAEHERPNAIYLGVGVVGAGVLAYTAYLGGKLVYDIGVGVEPAHGVYRTDAPTLRAGQVGAFFETALSDLLHGVQHMVQEVRKGQLVPTIVAWCAKHCGSTKQAEAAPAPQP